MASEILSVPEEDLHHVIDLLRTGLTVEKVPKHVAEALLKWCKEEEEYLRAHFYKEYWPKSQQTTAKKPKK